MTKHQKHSKLKRTAHGEFGRKELAILGAPCSVIQALVGKLIPELSGRNLYVDADHQTGERSESFDLLSDKIEFRRFESNDHWERYSNRSKLNEYDLILVNGNHFTAAKQIVIIHSKKIESLSRKLDRLTDVRMILLCEGMEIPGFLLAHLGEKINDIPLEYLGSPLLLETLREAAPPAIKGLVLAGGESKRMGKDKTEFDFHGKAQKYHMVDLLSPHMEEVYISCRGEQVGSLETGYAVLEDKFLGLGPFGAILSAFQSDPNAAWLVVASDLPLIDESHIDQLISNRNPFQVATSFRSPDSGFPEPLIAIWEPKAYLHLLNFLSLGYSCPRKVLINTDVNMIVANDERVLMNANTPEDLEKIKSLLTSAK